MAAPPNLILEMFMSPGTPVGAYERMAAAFGHGMIGVLLTSVLLLPLARVPWVAAVLALAVYAPWEAGQILIAGSSLADSLIDAGAVLAGALIGSAFWTRRLLLIVVLAPALLMLGHAAPRDQRGDYE